MRHDNVWFVLEFSLKLAIPRPLSGVNNELLNVNDDMNDIIMMS